MKKILLITNFLLAGLTYAQSGLATTENYVYEKNCLSQDCSKKAENVKYFDGLGRLVQNISLKATPSGKDIAVPIQYDEYGRQIKDYLPIPQSQTLDGGMYNDPLSNATNVYGNEKIYTEKVFEASPLDKVLQQKPIGNAWASHPANFSYSLNTANEVKKYALSSTWTDGRTADEISLSGTYPANSLYKSTVTDEDGNTTTEFKNKKGQSILIRKNDGTQNVDTYYVYNEFGKLSYTIPPLAAKLDAISQSTLNDLCYQYRYDGWNRLVEKKIPGKGWEYMVFDNKDRLILTQDANLRQQGKWIFTKYDQFSRPIYTGLLDSPQGRTAQVNAISGITSNIETRSTSSWNNSGMDVYYTNNTAYPTSNFVLLSVNYYDTYPSYSFNPSLTSPIQGKIPLTDNSAGNNTSTKGLPVMRLVKNIEDDNWTKNYIYYDDMGRTIGNYSINHLGGYTKTESDLDFAGTIKKTVSKHKRLDTDTERVITQTFDYDSQNRLLVQKHQIDNNPIEILSQNEYNELSQLKIKKVGGTNSAQPLQSINYTYNIKGAMIKMNDPANLNGKLFGYELKYDNPVSTSAAARYNGNIAEIDWRTSQDDVLRRYSYQYDPLNRMLSGIYAEPNTSAPVNNFFSESLEYDVNGNITKLYRNAKNSNGLAEQIDKLGYVYAGNQLITVNDTSTNYRGYPDVSGNTIAYDDNGNMTSQKDKGILKIGYNFLNLPSYLEFDKQYFTRGRWLNVNTNYTYRADGTKLKKVYKYSEGSVFKQKTTEYIDGFQYEIISTSGDPLIKFVPTSEGYFNFENNKYIYNYTDHLGNVRVSYFNNGSGAEVLEENNYYPFGLKHEGYNALAGNALYQYKYNGKEVQTETGWNDYGWRQYMPEIGRWNGIDQLAEAYLSTSTYAYVANNPISSFDVDGRWFNRDGSIDTSGHTPRFTSGKAMLTQFLGRDPGDGGGGNDGNLWSGIKDFFNGLFGGKKGKNSANSFISTPGGWTVAEAEFIPLGVVPEATTAESMVAVMEEISVAFTAATRMGVWSLPLILNGDSSHARGYDIPLTGTTDETAKPESENLYLYRNMRSVNGMPMVGEGLDKLGLRDRDVNFLSNSTMITPLFSNGLSVTIGYGNTIPSDVPDTHKKQILFRISASSLVSYGLIGTPVPNTSNPFYGQIRPATPMNVGTFRALIQTTAPAWQPVK